MGHFFVTLTTLAACVILTQQVSLVNGQDGRGGFFFCTPKRIVTEVRTCPCFLTGRFPRSQLLRLSLYMLPESVFIEWQDKFQQAQPGGPMPEINNSTGRVRAIRLLAARGARGESLWATGAQQYNETGPFVALFIASGMGCGRGKLQLEKRPDVCPLRLADRNSILAQRKGELSKFVVGGTKVADDDEFNGYNALISTPKGNCTGTVISNEWILTAAHCGVTRNSIVRVGGTNLSNGKKYFVTTSIRHQDYVGQQTTFAAARLVHDIAVLRVATPIENPRIIQLNSNAEGPDPGTIVRATGYGLISSAFPSNSLRMVDIPILSTEECRRRFRNTGKIRVARGLERIHHICSGRDLNCRSGGPCFGDSGGSVVARIPDGSLVQVGVTSFGDATCANIDSADVFTRVSSYIDWIQDATGNAATVKQWQSVNNIAEGTFGNESAGSGELPMWTIIVIAVGAGVAVVALGIVCFVLVGRDRNQNNGDASSRDSIPEYQNNASRVPSAPYPDIQPPQSAVLEQSPSPPSPQPSAPPPPLIPYPNNAASAPPPPTENSGATLGTRPNQ